MRFRIECVVDDKNLAKLLRTLADAGAYNVVPVPIVEAGAKANGAAPAKPTGKLPPKVEIIWQKIKAAGTTELTSKEMQDWIQQEGLAKSSYSYALRQLMKARLIKQRGVGRYSITA